jgi:hypothetical protein
VAQQRRLAGSGLAGEHDHVPPPALGAGQRALKDAEQIRALEELDASGVSRRLQINPRHRSPADRSHAQATRLGPGGEA